MPPPYRNPAWSNFSRTPYSPQLSLGEAPATWFIRLGLLNVPAASTLPSVPLTRRTLRSICIDAAVDVLHAYVCVMAWGRQDTVPGGKGPSNVRESWAARERLAVILQQLRQGGLSRGESYRLFLEAGAVPGLGPSFFTKLLYFFGQNIPQGEAPYIVDNEILDRMAHLTGLPFARKASCGGYQAVCWEMDQMVTQLSWSLNECNGSHVEERLFAWKPGSKASRMSYRQGIMFGTYSQLPVSKSDF